MKISTLLWLHNPLKSTNTCCCMIAQQINRLQRVLFPAYFFAAKMETKKEKNSTKNNNNSVPLNVPRYYQTHGLLSRLSAPSHPTLPSMAVNLSAQRHIYIKIIISKGFDSYSLSYGFEFNLELICTSEFFNFSFF